MRKFGVRRTSLGAAVFVISVVGGCTLTPRDRVSPILASVFDGGGYAVTVCDAAYTGRHAACTIRGSGPRLALRATLISGERIFVGGTLLTDADGRVAYAGCAPPASAPDTTSLDCPGALVSPGLINLHEHIDYSYQQPARPPVHKWHHRNEWRALSASERGFEGDAPEDENVRVELSERALLRHALSGETSIAGAKSYDAFLRNLRKAGALGTPGSQSVFDSTFPLNDGASMAIPIAPCSAAERAAVKFAPGQPLLAHVGEGDGLGARLEVDCMLEVVASKATPTAFVHGVGIAPEQVPRLARQGVAIVLSPRSNLELYGTTAPVLALQAAGVTLALGTDWSPSGSLTLLDEARCLARYNRDGLQGRLGAADLHRMMTAGAARAVGLQGMLGTLVPGAQADLVVFDTEGRTSLGNILEHTALPQTIAVMIAGRVASAPAYWAGLLPQLANCGVDQRMLCGDARWVCGADARRPLATLLDQTAYSIDDARLCRPQPTDDCVAR